MLGWIWSIITGSKYDKKEKQLLTEGNMKGGNGAIKELKKKEDFFDPYHDDELEFIPHETTPIGVVGFGGKGNSEATKAVTDMSDAFKRALGKKAEEEKNKVVEEVKEALKKSTVLVVDDGKVEPIIPKYTDLNAPYLYTPPSRPIVTATQKQCSTCNLKKQDDYKKHMADVVDKVIKEISEMPEEELKAELDKLVAETEKCNPRTCEGECMGKGDCDVAVEWQERINPMSYTRFNFAQSIPIKKHKKGKHNRHKGKVYKIKKSGIHRRYE